MTNIPTVTLNNGVKMPIEGFGGYQISNRECKQVVLKALETGYRLLDTAQAYQNERAVGEAMIESDVKREDIFLTTKVDFTNLVMNKRKHLYMNHWKNCKLITLI